MEKVWWKAQLTLKMSKFYDGIYQPKKDLILVKNHGSTQMAVCLINMGRAEISGLETCFSPVRLALT